MVSILKRHPRAYLSAAGVLTLLGVLVAGYHPGAEDDGVYLAAIQHNLNHRLFRADADFFALKLQATVFDKLMAASVRISHVPLPAMALAWHLLTILGHSGGLLPDRLTLFQA